MKRFVLSNLDERVISVDLHGFYDSSQAAHCAAIYLRVETSKGVQGHLSTSKSKVPPLKQLTIQALHHRVLFMISVVGVIPKSHCILDKGGYETMETVGK